MPLAPAVSDAPLATLTLADESQTVARAAALAPLLGPGDVLALSGPVGAGKSVFARALIGTRLAAAGREEEIPSPSFTLVQTYDDGVLEIWHCDLYRLGGAADVWELGLEDAFDTALCVIEWPERLGAALPPRALRLRLAPGPTETARRLEVAGPSEWRPRLAAAGFLPERAARDG